MNYKNNKKHFFIFRLTLFFCLIIISIFSFKNAIKYNSNNINITNSLSVKKRISIENAIITFKQYKSNNLNLPINIWKKTFNSNIAGFNKHLLQAKKDGWMVEGIIICNNQKEIFLKKIFY